MGTITRILFPFDFSLQSRCTLPYVRALARACDARVTVLSVAPTTLDASPAPDLDATISQDTATWREDLQARLRAAIADEFPGVDVEAVADYGDPALRIVEFAHGHAVDLIAMPTHGLGLFQRLTMGSVTLRVLHDARCPVWTAAHAETPAAAETPTTILCATDGTPASIPLMRYADEFATRIGAALRLLHVVVPISDWPSLDHERRLQDHVRDEARAAAAEMAAAAGLRAPLHVVVGEVAQAVVDEAGRARADIVLIGRGAVTQPFGRLRTHAIGIIQHSPCPVLSV